MHGGLQKRSNLNLAISISRVRVHYENPEFTKKPRATALRLLKVTSANTSKTVDMERISTSSGEWPRKMQERELWTLDTRKERTTISASQDSPRVLAI